MQKERLPFKFKVSIKKKYLQNSREIPNLLENSRVECKNVLLLITGTLPENASGWMTSVKQRESEKTYYLESFSFSFVIKIFKETKLSKMWSK
jgi:hypothetical protein